MISIYRDDYIEMLQNYTSIVEKTNDQLSLWYNPYGLMVGVLTIILAVATILVSVWLTKNSSEERRRQKEFYDEQERLIKERITAENNRIKEMYEQGQAQFQIIINEKRQELENATTENKEKINQEIEKLKVQKASLGFGANLDKYGGAINTPVGSMVCKGCNKIFIYPVNNQITTRAVGTFETVTCPHCGCQNFTNGF